MPEGLVWLGRRLSPGRRLCWIAALVAVAVTLTGVQLHRSRNVRVPLLTSAVAIAENGRLTPLAPGTR